jgi:predicted Zn-dependent protease
MGMPFKYGLPMLTGRMGQQRTKRRPGALRSVTVLAVAAQLALAPVAALAQQSVAIVRDAEIEALMRDYAQPILKAAGLASSKIEIVLVNDSRFNAFVSGRRIFFNTGALAISETPNELIGVLAHEAGHIAGGHQERMRRELDRAKTVAIVGALVGLGVGIAGSAAGARGASQLGAGIAMGAPEMARRGLLSYQRGEESNADRSAIIYLEKTGQSPRGMLRTFERFAQEMSLSGTHVDPYQISHPTPRERIANLERVARESPYFDRDDPPALQMRHDMVRAKIAAYTMGGNAVERMFRNDPRGIGAHYGDAITTYLRGNPRTALTKVDALLKSQPNNPYMHELRGEVLMKANRPGDAAAAFAKAIALDPDRTGILRVSRGQALLAAGAVKEATAELKAGLDRDPEYATGYRSLAQAYGMSGEVGLAELATAEGHYQAGQYRDAKIFAARAQQKVKKGSPPWVRAQDIINFKPPK